MLAGLDLARRALHLALELTLDEVGDPRLEGGGHRLRPRPGLAGRRIGGLQRPFLARLLVERELEDPLVLDVLEVLLPEIEDTRRLPAGRSPSSARVVSDRRIWPPWPAEQMRAARTTSIPT